MGEGRSAPCSAAATFCSSSSPLPLAGEGLGERVEKLFIFGHVIFCIAYLFTAITASTFDAMPVGYCAMHYM
jgi:hypothetical protein